MDFIEGLPMSKGKLVVMVVVDRLSKYSYFIPLSHPFIAIQVAQAFLDNIYKLHGLPKDIISLAEYWYNTNFHIAINTTPYEVLHGQALIPHIAYVQGESKVDAVDRSLSAREAVVSLLKFHLKRSQDKMKSMAAKRSDREIKVDSWVYVKLQPYRQATMRKEKYSKLSAKFFGPYKVVAKVGKVAYKLAVPVEAQIHPMFHVSELKIHRGDVPTVQNHP
ncbi:retrotransposon-related protein [Tanacetum coccineum]